MDYICLGEFKRVIRGDEQHELYPFSIIVSPVSGHLVVSEAKRPFLKVLNPDGTLIKFLGNYEFGNPHMPFLILLCFVPFIISEYYSYLNLSYFLFLY